LTTKPAHKEFYERLSDISDLKNLSQSALETLAIVAYNEPVTRAEVDGLRGVSTGQMIRKLVAKDFLKVVGRSQQPGRPILYSTTDEFLDYFGLNSTKDLPSVSFEDEKQDDVILYDSKYKEEL
jgi:segregation and condensation protein B